MINIKICNGFNQIQVQCYFNNNYYTTEKYDEILCKVSLLKHFGDPGRYLYILELSLQFAKKLFL